MFQLLFKNSIRHLKRNKLFTFLNILGLTIGISSCWIIFKFVNYELSFESGIPNRENTYRLISKIKLNDEKENWTGGVSRPIFLALRDEVRSLERAVPVYTFFTQKVAIPGENGKAIRTEDLDFDSQVIETEETYFDMVPYHWLAGKKAGALSNPNQIVLTEERANFYFPNTRYEDMIGKTLIYSDTIQMAVSGIVESLKYPSEFKGKEFLQLRKAEAYTLPQWTNTNGSDRIYMQANDEKSIQSAYKQISNIVEKKFQQYQKKIKPKFKYERTLELLQLKESHFSTYFNEFGVEKSSKTVIYGLIAVSIFLLVLACINYINLTTAQIPQRSKEIGIRKTLGGSKRILILQMMIETAIIIGVSILASYFVSKLGFYFLGELISDNVKDFNNPLMFGIFIFVILLFTLILAGLYPSWLISKVNAIEIFRSKGNLNTSKGNFNLRKVLIIFQFIIAQIFIVAALIIGQQLKYTIKKDLGFNKDAVVTVNIPYKLYDIDNFNAKKKTLTEELSKITGIKEVSLGNEPLSAGSNSTAMEFNGSESSEPFNQIVFRKSVDSKYMEFYDLQLLAGNNLVPSDTAYGYIINETALKGFGFKNPQDAIGKIIGQKGFYYPIIGVMKDFHAKDFYNSIEPLALMNGSNANTYNIRLNQIGFKESKATMEKVKSKWSEFFPAENFDYKFMDDSILALYKKEQQLQKLTNISTTIAIILSCLGLFGLATISAFQRTKEIGIRKVLGASVSGIVGMLSKDFVKMVCIAIIIASPIVWWACNKWLEDFVYRIEISWIPFVFGGLIAIAAALLTVSYQALKAANVNPVDSLRDE
ncbi:ABC transporter permease [Sphingobacterium sp. 1.A.5]|uniref:ABC transporter permease n=1 Tax=Sphingobacterium sp. 1.A.5 TaxID=2044604 RepID=UPI000C0BC3C0|nr:ABC transporter permease [Sphingobacterium sp. 1.A.5]